MIEPPTSSVEHPPELGNASSSVLPVAPTVALRTKLPGAKRISASLASSTKQVVPPPVARDVATRQGFSAARRSSNASTKSPVPSSTAQVIHLPVESSTRVSDSLRSTGSPPVFSI